MQSFQRRCLVTSSKPVNEMQWEQDLGGTANAAEDRTIRKIAWRLVPFLMLLYLIAFLDRINVGFAALTMNREIGLTPRMYGFGSGIFFLGYVAFEVPSTLLQQ